MTSVANGAVPCAPPNSLDSPPGSRNAGNFATVAIQCLEKLSYDRNGAKVAFNCDHHTFNFMVEGGYSERSFPHLSYCAAPYLEPCDTPAACSIRTMNVCAPLDADWEQFAAQSTCMQ